MNYANNRGTACFHCSKSIDSHDIPLIASDDATEKLAKSLQAQLDKIYGIAVAKGYELPQDLVMVGAAIATIGTNIIKVATLSGGNANAILNIMPKSVLGKDVALIGDTVALSEYKSIIQISLLKKVTAINNGTVVITPPTYPVGSCAAQKLLNYIIKQTDPTNKKRITKINMAEIFWKTGGKSRWSTGELVGSCNTCNWVLPMMLCNYDTEFNKVPYK